MIRTLHGALAGMQPAQPILKVTGALEAAGILHSLLYTPGRPGAGVAPSPGLAGAALTSYAGQIPRTDPVGLGNQAYLALLEAASPLAGTLLVYDRLWHNSGLNVTTTTAQTVNSVAFPARDRLGAVDGDGVLVGLEVSTATTNAGAITNTTLSYTNQAGTAGRTASIASFPATAVAGSFVPFALQAGDLGVRSIQSVTLGTSYAAGAIHLVAYRPLGSVPCAQPGVVSKQNAVDLAFLRLYDGTVPWLVWLPSSTGGVSITAAYAETQG